MAVDSPGHNRQLPRQRFIKKLVDLAVGTHFVPMWPGQTDLHIMISSAGGTANIAYTFDPGNEADLSDGVAAPNTGWATGVLEQVWSVGATADGVGRIVGPVTGILITVATDVATVTISAGIHRDN